jgi:hypothetical protein
MRALLLATLLVGCSYDWASVQAYTDRDGSTDGFASADPRQTVLPGTSCNPVSMRGCADTNYCLGMVESDGTFSSLTCHGSFGSGSQGTFCDGAINCVPGFICWTDPSDATQTTCQEPCFSNEDCASGACDTTGRYAIRFGTSMLYRCL